MKINFSSRVRLEAKASLGIVKLLSDDEDFNDTKTYWTENHFIIDDDYFELDDLSELIWNNLIGSGSNEEIAKSLKVTKQPLDHIGKVGDRDFYKLQKGAVQEFISRWYAFAGANVGRAELLVNQYKMIDTYFKKGKEFFIEDLTNMVNGKGSMLSMKNPSVCIGAEDYAARSGGATFGCFKNSEYTVHPITFLLALEAAPLLGIKYVGTVDEEGQVITKYMNTLEMYAPSWLTAPVVSYDTSFYATIFPIWTKPMGSNIITDEIINDKFYVNDNSNIKEIFETLTNSIVFSSYEIFLNSNLDSNNRFTLYYGDRPKYGKNIIASRGDMGLTTNIIARNAGFSSFDSFAESDWGAYKQPHSGSVIGKYLVENRKITEKNLENTMIIISHIDDNSIEFSIALMLLQLRVLKEQEQDYFNRVLLNGQSIIEEALTTNFKIIKQSWHNLDGISALQHNLPCIDQTKLSKFMTQLCIMRSNCLFEYSKQNYENIKTRKAIYNGKEIRLGGLPLLYGWSDLR